MMKFIQKGLFISFIICICVRSLQAQVIIGNDHFVNAAYTVVDAYGKIYATTNLEVQVFDNAGNLLRRFGTHGRADGQLYYPRGIAVDGAGKIYVADYGNHRIQVFNSEGQFLYKFGSAGTGTGQFSAPSGIAVDGAGNIYVGEQNNHRVQVFDNAGNFLRAFGSRGSGNGQFDFIISVTLDAARNIYVSNGASNSHVQVFSHDGTFLRKFGTTGSGNGQFFGAGGIAVDRSGLIYVTDEGIARVQVFNNAGQFLRKFGTFGHNDGELAQPKGLALDNTGNIYVVGNSRMQVFSNAGTFIRKFGCWGTNNDQFQESIDMATDASQLYVLDRRNYRVQVFDRSGGFVRKFGSFGDANGQFIEAGAIATDGRGKIYASDNFPSHTCIQVFDNSGNFLYKFGSNGTGDGQFTYITSMTVDGSGNIYIVDSRNSRVQVFDNTGAFLRKFGSAGAGDGQFNSPGTIALDSDGNIYVADYLNERAQVFDNSGNFLRKFGSAGSGRDQFASGPGSIALDAAGRVYITDSYSTTQRVMLFDNAGNFLSSFGSLGNGPKQFNGLGKLSVSGSSLFVADASRIMVFGNGFQTLTFDALPAKQYGDPAFRLMAAASSGLPVTFKSSNPGVVSISGDIATIIGAGTTRITASQPGNAEYLEADSISHEQVVNKKDQVINFPAIPLIRLGTPPFALAATASSGLPVTYTSSNTTVATIAGNIVTVRAVGSSTITARQPGNGNYLAAADVQQVLTARINQAITFNPVPAKTFGDAPFSLTLNSSAGLPINYSSSDPSVLSISGNIVTVVGAGSATITASQPGNDFYAPAVNVTRTVTVNKASQTITFTPVPVKRYGDPAFELGAESSSGLPVSFYSYDESVATIEGNILTIKKAGIVYIAAQQAGNNNYSPGYTDQELVIEKASQRIHVDALPHKTYGDEPFALPATSDAGLSIVYTSADPGVAEINGHIVTITGAGTTTITATQTGDDNHEAAVDIHLPFTVRKAVNVILFDVPGAHQYGDAPFQLTATSTSGLPVQFASSDELLAGVSGNIVTIRKAGTLTIFAYQPASANYEAADTVLQTLFIDKANQAIEFEFIPSFPMADTSFLLHATSSSGLPVNFTIVAGNITISGNRVTVIEAGPVTVAAVQEGNENYYPAEIVSKHFCVNPARPFIGEKEGTVGVVLVSNSITGNQWYVNDQIIAGATGREFEVGESGRYTLRTNAGTCVSEFSAEKEIVLNDNLANARIYPVPVKDKLTIDMSRLKRGLNFQLTIYDLNGRRIASQVISSGQLTVLNIGHFVNGSYIVSVRGDRQKIKKVIVKY
jgi:sugar lactone lactonase YvrE